VDDEPEVLSALSDYLGMRLGKEVEGAMSSEAALRMLAPRHELLVVDFRMPGMDGIELIRAAKQRFPALPCILFTAYKDDRVAQRAAAAGAAVTLSKEIIPIDLAKRIQDLLARAHG